MRLLDRGRSRLPGPLRVAVDWAVTLLVAAVVVLVFEAEVAKPYRIPSESMEPTLHCASPAPGCEAGTSDRIIALRLAYDFESPERGQVVVFEAPATASICGSNDGGSTFVKRLIGLPGDRVTEHDGYISINGHPLDEPYVSAADRDHRSGTWLVPAGSYFFLGDNRANSCDSRDWGSVPRRELIGPAVLRYWPLTRLGMP